LHQEVPLAHVLYALNGSIVALGVLLKDVDSQPVSAVQGVSTPIAVQDNNVSLDGHGGLLGVIPTGVALGATDHECIGMGVIRSIDVERRLFYIVTPVDVHLLQRVNLLIRGSGGKDEMPACLMSVEGRGWDQQMAYMSFVNTDGMMGAVGRKSTKHLQRRRLQWWWWVSLPFQERMDPYAPNNRNNPNAPFMHHHQQQQSSASVEDDAHSPLNTNNDDLQATDYYAILNVEKTVTTPSDSHLN
jgi:hypothetical protein